MPEYELPSRPSVTVSWMLAGPTMEKHGHAAETGTFAFADVTIEAGAHRLTRGGRDIAIELEGH